MNGDLPIAANQDSKNIALLFWIGTIVLSFIPGLVVYRFYGPLVFANVRFFIERLEFFIARETEPVRQVILDARAIPDIDVTAAEQVRLYFERLRDRGIQVVVAKAHLPLREAAERLGLKDVLSNDTYSSKVSDAVAEFERTTQSEIR